MLTLCHNSLQKKVFPKLLATREKLESTIHLRSKDLAVKILISILLIVHGLITAAQSSSSFNPTGGVQNPNWISWWHTTLGQSWLLSRFGLEKSALGTLAGLLWLISGAALIAAGMGLLGLIVPSPWWRVLAGVGAYISIFLFVIYAHPFYALGFGANLVILIVLLWVQWPTAAKLGG